MDQEHQDRAPSQAGRPPWRERLKALSVPHPLLILFGIVLIAALATHLLPGGQYERVERDGRLVAVAGSYHVVPSQPQGLGALVLAPFNGLLQAAEIIFLVFIIGGAFAIVKDSGALTAGIHQVTRLLKGRELVSIPILMLVFGAAGGTFGMYEEVLPFIGLVVPMAIAMGYDSITGVAMVYLGTVLGFMGAFYNPFTVGIAQGIAGLPLFSGVGYRLLVWAVIVGAGIAYTMRYAARVKRDPRSSRCYEADAAWRASLGLAVAAPATATDPAQRAAGPEASGTSPAAPTAVGPPPALALTGRQRLVLALVGAAFVVLPIGVSSWAWGMKELTGLFVVLGVACAVAGGRGANASVASFIEGARDMMTAALLIGIARGVKLMLDDGLVMDTILYYLAAGISYFPKLVAVQIMFLVQCAINLFIQSGSAQAAVSMPIMAPLADMLGITRQTAVLAFQLGDGFTNFAIPWNGITLAVLNLGAVPIWAWFRWAWRLQAWLILVCMALLIWPTLAAWGPF